MSFTKNLGRFEDDMRTLREKRTEPDWSFCDYFMVQEELAFVFEMLQQFEDALVQYDELDALFTQYVLNFGAGDGANWLGSFCAPVRSWNGLGLRRPIDMEKREQIQRGQASLLDLRSYLFSRQCTLLVFLQRPWEVTQRALELLHNCVQELRLLEVSVLQGALDCWVFLSCLEVLQRIEGCCDRAQLEANCTHTVGLWAYASEKLKSLGSLCGLMSENGPNSEDLNRTVDLLAGLGTERPETAFSPLSPYKKLKEALSSVEAFERHYLDLTHAAMEMYRAIGRLRSARLVGKSLAEFYMRKGAPRRAEGFLQDALSCYVQEGWALPVTHTRTQVAQCQRLLQQTKDYLQTSALLAGDANLPEDKRRHFCQEILTYTNHISDSQGHKVVLSMSAFAQLRELQFRPAVTTVHVGAALQVELQLCSLMPVPVQLEQLSVSVHFSLERGGVGGRTNAGGGAKAQHHTGTVQFPMETTYGPSPDPRLPGPALQLQAVLDRSASDHTLNTAGVACKNVHLLLRRRGSSASLDTPSNSISAVTVDDGAQILKTSGVKLLPGNNSIVFTAPNCSLGCVCVAQSGEPGTYTLRQLCASVGRVQFLLPHIRPTVQYHTFSQQPQLTIQPLTETLLAGLQQKVKFAVVTGHYSVKKGDALQLSNTDAMVLLHSSSCPAQILSSTGELVGESVLSIQSSERVMSIALPLAPPYHSIEFQLEVLSHIPALPPRPQIQRLTNGEPHHARAKPCTRSDCAMTAIEQKVSVDCPWSIYSTPITLTFHVPFSAKHSLLSAGDRKYIQVCVQNVSEMNFHLAELSLTEREGTTLELQSLNDKTRQLVSSQHFSPVTAEASSFRPYLYEFQLESLSTLYSVKAEILPSPGAKHCHTGSLCWLEVCITRLAELSEAEREDTGLTENGDDYITKMLYEVVDDSSNWAVCGRSSGLVSIPVAVGTTHRLQMEVMPLFAGNLPFPTIKLFKYLPHFSTPTIQPETDGCLERDSVSLLEEQMEDSASIHSRGSVLSLGGSEPVRGPPLPRREPFSTGQVFYCSRGRQVLVLPGKDDHLLEVNVT
ncbi:hypothetical protein AGOR_G00220290 [Albula goreensis]|uniref:Trafficking protein particle complex subunit 10 n=1 Tax=Albula goreensis TaxID=1534307 RepID=A0A8T3CLZ9_9TELE|nr:hypothetical protein AGOR_G00220290 [Albula goreensis]